MKIAVSVIFDENYVEPALITVFDLVRFAPDNFEFILVYMESYDEDINTDVANLIGKMIDVNSVNNKISSVKFKSTIFDKFQKYHFTNSILYKLILPEIINHDYIINIDAGFLSGININYFFKYLLNILEEPQYLSSSLGAVCFPSPKDLPEDLRRFKHNSMYPTGWILIFNCEIYKQNKLFDRLISGYSFYKDQLVWAEQDLLCMILEEGELYNLNLHSGILIESLTLEAYIKKESSLAFECDFMLYKIIGTLKPWKIWVLDPKKIFYLERREKTLGNDNFLSSSVVMNNRFKVNHQPLYRAFLSKYESELINIKSP